MTKLEAKHVDLLKIITQLSDEEKMNLREMIIHLINIDFHRITTKKKPS